MELGDGLLLAWGTVLLYLPGVAVTLAARRFPPRAVVAAAPVVSIGVFYLTSLLSGVTGLPFGLATVAAVTVLVCGLVLAVGREWHRPTWPTVRAVRPLELVGAAAVLVAVVIGLRTFSRGLGRLSVLPQEHDLIIHGQLVARIMRTGQAAPWQSYPGDLITGRPPGFYPNGFHQLAALVGSWGSDPVTALNAAMVVLLAVALPVGVALLGSLLRPRSLAPLIGGVAALVAAVSYRPTFALLHDGGILSNAAALAVAPGAIALFVVVGRLGWRATPIIALAMTGALVLHPTALATVGVTVAVWLVAAAAASRSSLRQVLADVRVLAVGAVVAVVALVPFLVAASSLAETVTNFPRDYPVTALPESLGITFGAPYGGFLDRSYTLSQVWLVVLPVLGVVACVVARANAPLVAGFTVWAAVLLGFLHGVTFLPIELIAGLFYSSYVRISGCFAIMQWLAAGVAVAAAVWGLRWVVETVAAAVGRTRLPLRAVTVAGGVLAVVVVLFVVALPYAQVNGYALSRRYVDPEFVRVDEDDLAAARYVADRVEPGQRVMNNANDGSTYGYVLYDVPLIETAALGSMPAPYTIELLKSFDEFNRDAEIRADVCRLDIAWVIADAEAPPIWAPAPTYSWVDGGYLSVPPGMEQLSSTANLTLDATFGDVSVYSLDLAALDCPRPSD